MLPGSHLLAPSTWTTWQFRDRKRKKSPGHRFCRDSVALCRLPRQLPIARSLFWRRLCAANSRRINLISPSSVHRSELPEAFLTLCWRWFEWLVDTIDSLSSTISARNRNPSPTWTARAPECHLTAMTMPSHVGKSISAQLSYNNQRTQQHR